MRKEYDIRGGERGKFYGKVTGVRVIKSNAAKRKKPVADNNDVEEINILFRRLWSKAEGQEGYKRSEWAKLGKLLNKNNVPVK